MNSHIATYVLVPLALFAGGMGKVCNAAITNGNSTRLPNIVLILADDLGWHEVGCYGGTYYQTPNVDFLAQTGMRFQDAYAACPVCSPTRASLMTGKYPARLHLTDFIPGRNKRLPGDKLCEPNWIRFLPLQEVTLAEGLHSAGYRCGHFGKWHLNKDKKYSLGRPGDPGSQGFDDVLTTHKPGAGPKSKYDNDAHHVREITERSLAFIERNRDRPFFCYISHNSIHAPIVEQPEQIARYQAKPGADRPDHNPTVGAMVETLDSSVGEILNKLDELKLTNNTLVIFFSDNGCLWGRDVLKPLRGGKAQLYEGGIRVPLVVRWPGRIKSRSVATTPVSSVDFFPTLLEIAGQDIGDFQIDGVSLLPLFTGLGDLSRDAIYWHYPHYHKSGLGPSGAIRCGPYKLIEWFDHSLNGGVEVPGAIELYDLQQDISEQHNLVDKKPKLARQLYEKLKNWRLSVGAQEMECRKLGGFGGASPNEFRGVWRGIPQ